MDNWIFMAVQRWGKIYKKVLMNGNGLFFLVAILLVKGLNAKITEGPSNTVAEIGRQAQLNCTANAKIAYWTLSKDGDSSVALAIVGPGCATVNDLYRDNYAVESTVGEKSCNLIVFNITMQQAGVYKCIEAENVLSSILTVLEMTPNVTYNTTENVVVENDNVIIACTLSYSGSVSPAPTLRPYFHWTDERAHQISSSYDSTTENQAVSQISVTAGRQNITSYTCHVYLQLSPSTNPNYANNTPTLNKSSVSSTIEVLFGPSVPIITSWTESEFKNGINCDVNILWCNSSGNPPPMYKWFDANPSLSDVISKEQNLSYAKVNHNYKCEASNTIRNVMYTNSANYIVVMPANSTNNNTLCETSTPDVTDNHLLRTILLAAILGGYGLLNIIATIVFIIYYNRKSNKDKLNVRFPWLQNMLPCMNEKRGNAGCKFVSVILFIVMSLLAGIILFPILVAIAICSRRSSDSMANSDIRMRDAAYDNHVSWFSPNSKAAGNPSTTAHGDVEAHYDVIRNTTQTANDYNESTSNDAKKFVPYTLVRPNGNTADDVDGHRAKKRKLDKVPRLKK